VAPLEADTWHPGKATRGSASVAARDVSCQRGTAPRQLPVWHDATSAASVARATWLRLP